MIPIRDTIRARNFPVVTVSIIVVTILVFIYELSLTPAELDRFTATYGVVPALQVRMFLQAPLALETWIPMVGTIFLHGGWMHIFGNMLYLWVFGDNVEDILGRARFLAFYLLAGFAGSLGHIVTNPDSLIPTIGASGAVAGVLGAYFLTFPRSRVLALVPLLFIITFVEIPAVIFLFLWFALQLLSGLAAFAGDTAMVAWWAHVGGFAAGMVMVKLLCPNRAAVRRR
ncbi:MAG: rhomboid family intramembrane serine protease [Desulforudis sp.]|nr:MAG: rhomboid family intramembrane serine protease [Desulforudis sp.]